jgi:predicted DNA-binding transcriptional regulator YafY
MRASRLVRMLGLLQLRGRMTAAELAAELEVSQRTILRDIEALSTASVPVYAVRGCQGGFELLDGFSSDLPVPGAQQDRRPAPGSGRRPGRRPPGTRSGSDRRPPPGSPRRARVRLSPRGRRLAALLGRPAGVRIRRNAPPVRGREDWAEASVRIESVDSAVLEMLALGAEVEVLHPPELREQVGVVARKLAQLHADDPTRPDVCPECPGRYK